MANRRLALTPTNGEPFHWLPRQGEPSSICDWLTQQLVRTLAWWPIYTGIIVTLILVIQVVHPYGLGR